MDEEISQFIPKNRKEILKNNIKHRQYKYDGEHTLDDNIEIKVRKWLMKGHLSQI
jgi:hypothetical protein